MSFTRDYERPLHWQDFEELTRGLFTKVYEDTNAQKNGRSGQSQCGVDVFGVDHQNRTIGIQCKRLDEQGPSGEELAGGVIKPELILTEVMKAEKFKPKLHQFVIATTAKPDVTAQKEARLISEERRKKNKFDVCLWFWDYFNSWINNDIDIQKWYYRDIIQTRQPETTNRYILETFHMAFSRNAFRDRLSMESPVSFIKALEDTQKALSTGELRDRETKYVIRKAPGGISLVTNKEWQDKLRLVSKIISEVRTIYLEAKNCLPPKVIEMPFYLIINDPTIEHNINRLRANAIEILNEILLQANLPIVDSPLL
ncbi:hypothetical protein K2Y11_17715 [bacterium]|nr:hypothetical protein [bacterium]